MKKEKDESEVMEDYLKNCQCPDCKGELKLSGGCHYTDPLSWDVKCQKCELSGHIGYKYSGITVIDIPKSKMKEFEKLRKECDAKVQAYAQKQYIKVRSFYKKYGFARPRDTEIEIEMAEGPNKWILSN